jgi:hypothetical protein
LNRLEASAADDAHVGRDQRGPMLLGAYERFARAGRQVETVKPQALQDVLHLIGDEDFVLDDQGMPVHGTMVDAKGLFQSGH